MLRNPRTDMPIRLPIALALTCLLLAGCGGGGGTNDGDTPDGDGTTDGDTPPDGDLPPDGDAGCTTPVPVEPALDPAADSFALTMFHFNVQYVVGGLAGFDGVESFCGTDCDAWDNRAVEDWIVRETFAPVVDFYLAHPGWGVNFEMQAYMLEVIAERFPEVLDKLRTLTARGQMEISSFHYADQLFLAYPRADLDRSVAMTKEVFDRYCIPLSPVVFNQEGQAGEGRQQALVDHGYRIGVFPKNLYRYVRGEAPWWPYYESRGGWLVIGPGGVDPASGIRTDWLFFDDGELLAPAGGLDPYFAPFVGYKPERLEEYSARIVEREAAGYRIATISDFVRHLQAKGVEAPPAPPLLDGTWQPPSTESIKRWLGGRGQGTWSGQERDNQVRAGNYEARTRLDAAQVLYDTAAGTGISDPADGAILEGLWKKLMHAMISDSSGVNPWAGEVRWSLALNEEIVNAADELTRFIMADLGWPHARIDLADRTAVRLDDLPQPEAPDRIDPPLDSISVEAAGRTAELAWYRIGQTGEHYRLELTFGPAATVEEAAGRIVTLTLPRLEERIGYTPGLLDGSLANYRMEEFSFLKNEVYLPLSTGLIALGGGWHVIKHCRVVHAVARVDALRPVVQFLDETWPYAEGGTWVFDLFRGTETAALELADRINPHPVVVR